MVGVMRYMVIVLVLAGVGSDRARAGAPGQRLMPTVTATGPCEFGLLAPGGPSGTCAAAVRVQSMLPARVDLQVLPMQADGQQLPAEFTVTGQDGQRVTLSATHPTSVLVVPVPPAWTVELPIQGRVAAVDAAAGAYRGAVTASVSWPSQ